MSIKIPALLMQLATSRIAGLLPPLVAGKFAKAKADGSGIDWVDGSGGGADGYTSAPEALNDSPDPGSVALYAKGNHKHAHGAQTNPAHHGTAIATGTGGARHGFMHSDTLRDHDVVVSQGVPVPRSGDVTGVTDGAFISAKVVAGIRGFRLGSGDHYLTAGTLTALLYQGVTISGEATGFGSGHGTRIKLIGVSGARAIDLRGTFHAVLRNVCLDLDDLLFLGDVIDMSGDAADTVGAIIENVTFSVSSVAKTPAAPVPSSGSANVTITGTCTLSHRGVVQIEAGGTTFRYSETGGGAFGDVAVTAAADVNPWGTGDAQWVATGVAIPLGGTWAVPSGNSSFGLTLHFANTTYTAGVTYKFGLGPRRLVNGAAAYDCVVRNCHFGGGYDGVLVTGSGCKVASCEAHPLLRRYYAEAYRCNGVVVHGTATTRGVFAHNCEDATIAIYQGDVSQAGPWSIFDGNLLIRDYSLIQVPSGPAISIRNANIVAKLSGNYRACASVAADFPSGGGTCLWAHFDGYAPAAAWYSGSNISNPTAEGWSPSGLVTQLVSPDLQNTALRGAAVLGVQSDFASGTNVNWAGSPGWTLGLGFNTTITFTKPSTGAARSLELVIIPDATTYYTVAYPATIDWENGPPPTPKPGGSNLYLHFSYTGDVGIGVATGRYRGRWRQPLEVNALGTSGTTKTLRWEHSPLATMTMTGNCTVTLSPPPSPTREPLRLQVVQGVGLYTLTFSPALKTEAGIALVLSAVNGAKDTIYLDWDGTEYHAWIRKAWA